MCHHHHLSARSRNGGHSGQPPLLKAVGVSWDVRSPPMSTKIFKCPCLFSLIRCDVLPVKQHLLYMMEGRFGVSVCMKIEKYKVLYVCIDKNIHIYIYINKALTSHWTVLSIIQAHKAKLAQEFGTLLFCTSMLIQVLKALVKMLGCSLNSTPNKATFPSL